MITIKIENIEITVGGKVGWGISSIEEYFHRFYMLELTNKDLFFLNSILQEVDDGED